MTKIISIGYIPKDSTTDLIFCGDSENSNTMELNFRIENQLISGIDNDLTISFTGDFLSPNSYHLNELSKYISNFGLNISTNQIYNGFLLLDNQEDFFYQKFKVIDSSGGVFENKNQMYNGRCYFRKYHEINDEITKEKICIKML